jgi:regulation of enolase protein 1 (concanavalin A-like superfamily)
LHDKIKVGLAACSTSTEPFKVRFDQFKLTRGQKKSK